MTASQEDSWVPLDPYAGPPEEQQPTDSQVRADVAFFKDMAELAGKDPDPEWDKWVS